MRRPTLILVIIFLWTPLFFAACAPGQPHHHHHPADDDESPGDDDFSPGDDDVSPADDDTYPADDDASPADDDTSPSDDDGSPSDDDASPADDDGSPTDDDASPTDDDVSPSDDDVSSTDDDTLPSDDDGSPGGGGDDDDDTMPGDDDDNDDTTPDRGDDDDNDDSTPGGGDDDDNDDVTPADDDDDDDMAVQVEYVAGGTYSGAALTMDAAGRATVISGKSRELRAYTYSGGNASEELAAFGLYANPSAALGPDGSLHVAFYDWINKTLRYATNKGGAWTDSLVDGSANDGHYSGIALDGAGVVHIVYDVENSGSPIGVRHAKGSAGGWTIEDVATGGQVGDYPQIALDAAGTPYVTYNDESGSGVRLAQWNGASWDSYMLPYSKPYGRASAVAVGADGTLNLLYHQVSGGLVYASGSYGSMAYDMIPGVNNVADTLAMALDANGVVHITYALGAAGVGYGNNAGGTWTLQTIGAGYPVFIAANSLDDVAISLARIGIARKHGATWSETYFDYGFTAAAPAMRADPQGARHFVYLEKETATLRYATDSGGSWSFDSVASAIGNSMASMGLIVDASGVLDASFYNGAAQNLDYASNAGGAWTTGLIDGGPAVGTGSSMAMDGTGGLHVSYSDDGAGVLKYATNAGGAWQSTTVDNAGPIGASSAIAVDGAGLVYIAYNDGSAGAIKLATGGIGGFASQTVDAGGGNSVSLTLDANGQPQLAYVGAGLTHAALNGADWQVDVVDGSGTASGTAIATWGHEGLAIAYQGAGGALDLALGRPGAWWLLTIDNIDDVGQQPALNASVDGSHYDIGYLGQGGVWLATVTFSGK